MKSVAESDDIKENERRRVIHQINPHFIFNALAAIRVMTKVDSDQAYDLLYDFSKYLKVVFQSLTHWGNISMKEEIANVKSYVNLERARYGDNITICLDIEEDDFLIPPLSIQPFVENAIVHGLEKGRRKGTIWIRCKQTPSKYLVQVEDDGAGFDVEAYNRQCVEEDLKMGGLHSVKYLIEQQMSGRIEIRSAIDHGTVVTLYIPKIPKQNT